MNLRQIPLLVLLIPALAFAQAKPAFDYDADLDMPPTAKAGECFAKVTTPAKYADQTEKVLAEEASKKITTIPAKYEAISEKVMTSAESFKIEVVPATYKFVSEKVMIAPEQKELKTIPAKYKTVEEKVLISAATTEWKRNNEALGGVSDRKIDTTTGDILCKVEVPAKYNIVSRKVIETPESTEEVVTPAKYKTVKKRVIDQEATTKKVMIPAKFEMVEVKKLVSPAREEVSEIPAVYQTITKSKKVANENTEWRSILCKTNTTEAKVREIQAALQANGYDVSTDGKVGRGTMNAINDFQEQKGLPVDKYLNVDTLKALGVSLS